LAQTRFSTAGAGKYYDIATGFRSKIENIR